MEWLLDTAYGLENHVAEVARGRAPADRHDRERRLTILANGTTTNGDKAETLALIADLTAFVAQAD